MERTMQAHYNTNQEPHKMTRDLVAEFDTMPWTERRERLQALPLTDLVWLCHLLAEHRPHRFANPDTAWAWLRFCIEPLEWDIITDMWHDGLHYVALWAGQATFSRPANPGERIELCRNMDEWFAALYPKRLIDVGMEVVYVHPE
jgi:hypothetical protein